MPTNRSRGSSRVIQYSMFYKRESLALLVIPANKKTSGAFLFCLHAAARADNHSGLKHSSVCFLYLGNKGRNLTSAQNHERLSKGFNKDVKHKPYIRNFGHMGSALWVWKISSGSGPSASRALRNIMWQAWHTVLDEHADWPHLKPLWHFKNQNLAAMPKLIQF